MSDIKPSKKNYQEVIGLIPAGGVAKRIAPLPCSKELFPVGLCLSDDKSKLVTKVACQSLLEKMSFANINKAYVVLRKGKWDIPSFLGDGRLFNLNLAYLIMHLPFGTPYTIDQAYPFVKDDLVVFGFPDIIFEPDNAFLKLISYQASTNADVVLGLFIADQPEKMDMVEICDDNRVCEIVIKPQQTELKYTWIIAVWTPNFTHYMHDYLAEIQKSVKLTKDDRSDVKDLKNNELFVGDVIQASISDGFQVKAVIFPENHYIDIGTPEDLFKAVNKVNNEIVVKNNDFFSIKKSVVGSVKRLLFFFCAVD